MRIVLHIGAPKTGSSALQSAFVLNRNSLVERGIFYPRSWNDVTAAAGIPVSGNAIALAKFLDPNLPVSAAKWDFDACLAAIAEARRAGCSTVLYSSEYMSYFLPERMDEFLARVSAFGAWVEIVYFVRNIAGHALSSYRQNFKRGRFAGTFAAYVSGGYRPRFSFDIERSIAAVGRKRVTVLAFDDLRKSLFASMVEAMGHVAHGLPCAPEINTSTFAVTASEAEEAEVAAHWSDEKERVNSLLGQRVLCALLLLQGVFLEAARI